eukprot:GCRY01001343.1.p1 GENE.GCRY01001343.1~~GCRY01001343.1.p1  ORF type:complete len:403 (+),score=88.18 GCRY01001343.1:123-1331(+)
MKFSLKELCNFIDGSKSPFHSTFNACSVLEKAGFKRIKESDSWNLSRGGKYFFTRSSTAIVAFAVGSQFVPGNAVLSVGAHTDSPCFRVKPNSLAQKPNKLCALNAEAYGGGLWYTWFDRDLTLAGRVVIEKDKKLTSALVDLEEPVCRIPSLAIHLNRSVNDCFNPNKQEHCAPIMMISPCEVAENPLLTLIAEKVGCKIEDIKDMDLSVADAQPSALSGPTGKQMLACPRLDNLAGCYTALTSLIEASERLDGKDHVMAAVLFDHEEIGSGTEVGAASTLLPNFMQRLICAFPEHPPAQDAYFTSLRKSFVLSNDGAHAVHPAYAGKHDAAHAPVLAGGPVLKTNANAKYTTTGLSRALFTKLAATRDIPLQHFVSRNDQQCGSMSSLFPLYFSFSQVSS